MLRVDLEPEPEPAAPPGRANAIVEVALVLLVVFGPAVLAAGRDVVRGIFGWPVTPSPALIPFPDHLANQVFALVYWSVLAAPAALALLLLFRAGARPRDLGLWRPRWRDLLAAVVLVVGIGIVSGLGSLVLHLFHNTGVLHGTPLLGASPLDLVLRSLNAGVLEESVVLGYLVTRLELAGVSTPKAAAVSVAARTSYHLYYGTGALIPLLFGVLVTLYFVRFRRLLPVVAAHAAWDMLVSLPSAV